eukprot:5456167-Amphidinium_carterae.1
MCIAKCSFQTIRSQLQKTGPGRLLHTHFPASAQGLSWTCAENAIAVRNLMLIVTMVLRGLLLLA